MYYGTWAYSHALHATANNDTNTIKFKRITARLYWTYFIANFIHNLNTCNQHHVGHFFKRIIARLYWTYFIAKFIHNLNTYNQKHKKQKKTLYFIFVFYFLIIKQKRWPFFPALHRAGFAIQAKH